MTSDNVKLCGGLEGPTGYCLKCNRFGTVSADGCQGPAPEPPKTPPDLNRIAVALGVPEGAGFTLGELAGRAEDLKEGSDSALDVLGGYGGIDGSHHKTWVIDQAVRYLTGSAYDEWARQAKAGEDGPDTYDWDEGIAP